MFLLGLDTATLTLSAALVERRGEDDLLVERLTEPPPTPHSSLLPSALDAMLARAGLAPGDLATVVVGLGPGSFTGLRIGLATAKGLSYAASVPLAGASSLASMALAASPGVPEGTLLAPCLDARKGEVYVGLFRSAGDSIETLVLESVLAPEALAKRLEGAGRFELFGPGRDAYAPLAALPPPSTKVRFPDAFALVRLVRQLPAFSRQAVFAMEPRYVRPGDAEWTLKPKKLRGPRP